MTPPEISILVPVFNGSAYLREALLSVLADELPAREVILIDDGSTDGSLETVSDLPVITVRNFGHRGISSARNEALRRARGKFIAFLDQDDLLAEGGLSARYRWLCDHPEVPAVGGTIGDLIDRHGEHLASFEQMFHKSSLPPESRLTLDLFRRGQSFSCALWLFLFRRDFMEKIGWFDESLVYVQDHDYLIRALHFADIPFIPRPAVRYRLHANNTTAYLENGICRTRRECIAEAALVRLHYGLSLG